ncbi:type IV toxin-antitoxin system AbiEi family antitoxin [Castellaniella sp.]|uniref:type IV toxin-antitoxin system AbiEi family antitoxin domain-containing protein n=1 Tax=Castellaniella sp. TaxID=1955812 RepID=UPI002AFE5C6E|nr:type IV toxin-antitoxin system AbiEi family antitoxin [Castellaniella sp.]
MANQSRIQIAKPDIVRCLDGQPAPVFKLSDLKRILSEQRQGWRLAQRTTTQDFIDFLEQHGKLTTFHFPFPHREETRFVWGSVPLLEVLSTLKPRCYYSHYTAMRMHGLTEQIPKTIYLNHEQHLKSQSTGGLAQERIDAAFRRKARESNNVIDFRGARIYLINGKNTAELGVTSESVTYDSDTSVTVRLTSLERTLIDIAVRPAYAGGIFEVMKAFRLAKEHASVNALAAMLQTIDHTYPYHQVIGFYLERAGYRSSQLDLIKRFPMRYDFYLAHGMKDMHYIDSWRLYIPKGL